MKKKPKLNPSLPLTLRNYFSHPLKLNARGNLLDACPKVECSGQPTSAGTIAVSVCKPVPAKYTLRIIYNCSFILQSNLCYSSFYTELIEALSDPTGTPVVTTVNTIQPSAMIFDANSDIACMSPGETQPVVNASVTDVALVTETICTQSTVGDEGMHKHQIVCYIRIVSMNLLNCSISLVTDIKFISILLFRIVEDAMFYWFPAYYGSYYYNYYIHFTLCD